MQVIDHINTANSHVSYTSDTAGASSRAVWLSLVDFRFGRFGYKIYSWYDESELLPQERRRFDIRRRNISAEFEEQQFHQNIQYGADGSIISDDDDVYLLEGRFQVRVTKIDYFHGCHIGVATAQLLDKDGTEALALNMLQLAPWGVAVHCITVLQRKWRKRQWRLCVLQKMI